MIIFFRVPIADIFHNKNRRKRSLASGTISFSNSSHVVPLRLSSSFPTSSSSTSATSPDSRRSSINTTRSPTADDEDGTDYYDYDSYDFDSVWDYEEEGDGRKSPATTPTPTMPDWKKVEKQGWMGFTIREIRKTQLLQ